MWRIKFFFWTLQHIHDDNSIKNLVGIHRFVKHRSGTVQCLVCGRKIELGD